MFYAIVTYPKTFNDYYFLKKKLESLLTLQWDGVTIVSNDKLVERYAQEKGYTLMDLPSEGVLNGTRTDSMNAAQNIPRFHAVLAFWDGVCEETKQLINFAGKQGLQTRVIRFK